MREPRYDSQVWRLVLLAATACGRISFDPLATGGPSDGSTQMMGDTSVDAGAREALLATAFAYWPFDVVNGTMTPDATGHGHTMNLMNGATLAPGMFDNAVSSDGVDDYGITPNLDLTATNVVSISLWSNRNYVAGPNHTLFELSTDSNNGTGAFGFFPDDTLDCAASPAIYTILKGNIGENRLCFAQPTSGVWHHLVVIYDKSTAAIETSFYVDGVAQTVQVETSFDNTNTFGNLPLYLFSRAGTTEFNPGLIDEMTIFTRALSLSEIALL